MSIFTNAQIALDTRLSTLTGLPSTAWENIQFDPEEGVTWVRPTTLWGSAEVTSMERLEKFVGIYQIDVFEPIKKGPGAMNTLLDSIRDHFKASVNLTAGTDVIIIRNI